MQERNLLFANLALYQLLLIFLAGFQSSVWLFQGFGPSPFLWLIPLLYFGVYRHFHLAVIYCYLSSAFLMPFTSASYGFILCLQISIFLLARFFKTRIFWSDYTYHVLVCVLFTILAHLAAWVLSISFDSNPIAKMSFVEVVGSTIFTGLIGPVFLSLFLKLDRAMGQEVVLLTGIKVQ